MIPSVVFIFTGIYRYFKIRDYGQGRTVYSKHFKAKFLISACMASVYLIIFFMIMVLPQDVKHSGWINRCDLQYFSMFYVFVGFAWLGSCFLMVFEYQRRLSEEWYANQLFWCTNLLFSIISLLVLGSTETYSDKLILAVAIIEIIGNALLVILMLKTERRTVLNMRPEPSSINAVLLSSEFTTRRGKDNENNGPFIKVRFLDKVINGPDGVNEFQFRVTVH